MHVETIVNEEGNMSINIYFSSKYEYFGNEKEESLQDKCRGMAANVFVAE